MFGYDHHWLGGWGMILIWIIIIAAVFYMIFRLTEQRRRNGPKEMSALDTLKKRFAAGEISSEEYEQMKKQLTKD
jgi:putative membrane protein